MFSPIIPRPSEVVAFTEILSIGKLIIFDRFILILFLNLEIFGFSHIIVESILIILYDFFYIIFKISFKK